MHVCFMRNGGRIVDLVQAHKQSTEPYSWFVLAGPDACMRLS